MKRRAVFTLVLALVLLAATGCRKKQSGYEFVEVKRGDIANTVSSTGQLQPVGSVDVGTQVSGTVDRVLVDYNDHVKRGQLLAVLDTSTLAAQVHDAEAGLARAESQNDIAQSALVRTRELFGKGMSSPYDTEVAHSTAVSSASSLQSARAALERTRLNLGYAFVRSPINGTVIGRKVEPGQTVAASFSTPTLFTIVEDLSRMQILAQVDESDIGQIDSGMQVKFTVQAYPDREFTGTTVQVRLEPQTISNVVSYTVVVDAPNEDQKLLPGMTATADFYVDQRTGVLTVPSTALAFRPTQTMMAALRKEQPASATDSTRRSRRSDSTRVRDTTAGGTQGTTMKRLWYLDAKGTPAAVLVQVGASDGRNTEVTPVQGTLTEGMKIISKAPGTPFTFGGPGGFGGPPPGR